MKPSEDEYRDWLGHPVTEWVLACMKKAADSQKTKWAEMAWDGDLDPMLHKEAQVRADCYAAMPESSYEDWEAIDDSED
tara:strand:- start:10704 stop:10940 length:237 start_codon:yes stop_codon:yes gene_type:complete